MNSRIFLKQLLTKVNHTLSWSLSSRCISKMLSNNQSHPVMFCQSGKHKIGVVQMTCKADKDDNFNIAAKLIREAKEKGSLVNSKSHSTTLKSTFLYEY